MVENVQQFFDDLAQRESIASLSDTNAKFQFVIRSAGDWHVSVDEGIVTVTEGRAKADVTIDCGAEDFLRMLRGEQNWFTTFLRGAMKLKGDYTKAYTVTEVMAAVRA